MATSTRNFVVSIVTLASCLLLSGLAIAKSPLDGLLTVKNSREQSVRVKIDGRFVGVVYGQSKRTFQHVPNGVRLVRVRGSGPGIVEKISVPISGEAQMRIHALRGAARITNRSETRVRLRFNGRRVGSLRPGQTYTSRKLRPGIYDVTAFPVDRSQVGGRVSPQRQRIRISAGRESQINVKPFFAKLTVNNPYDRRVALTINGQRVQRIPARSSVTITRIAPGTHSLALRKRGQILSRQMLRLNTERNNIWTPQRVTRSGLRISNNLRRPVRVSVDNQQSQWLEAGSSALFTNLESGVAELRIQRLNGRVITRSVLVPRRGFADFSVARNGRTRIAVQRQSRAPRIASR